jgi:hypothetical protein
MQEHIPKEPCQIPEFQVSFLTRPENDHKYITTFSEHQSVSGDRYPHERDQRNGDSGWSPTRSDTLFVSRWQNYEPPREYPHKKAGLLHATRRFVDGAKILRGS